MCQEYHCICPKYYFSCQKKYYHTFPLLFANKIVFANKKMCLPKVWLYWAKIFAQNMTLFAKTMTSLAKNMTVFTQNITIFYKNITDLITLFLYIFARFWQWFAQHFLKNGVIIKQRSPPKLYMTYISWS